MNLASIDIFGARGYSGVELLRLLARHSSVGTVRGWLSEGQAAVGLETLGAAGLEAGASSRIAPLLRGAKHWSAAAAPGRRVAFLALPAEASAEWTPRLLSAGYDVIDLSGAWRLGVEGAARTYGLKLDPAIAARARYGLVPWARENGTSSGSGPVLVSNPGCYATAALMALIPLFREGLLEPAGVVIDGKSGTTGAGRKASAELLFSEVFGDCRAYRVGRHQHEPEIARFAAALGGAPTGFDPAFATHLLPVARGISLSVYGRTTSDAVNDAAVEAAYARHYAGYPLARFETMREGSPLLSLAAVVGTPRIHLCARVAGRKLYVSSMIDNLLKGAASQACENFNLLLGLPAETCL